MLKWRPGLRRTLNAWYDPLFFSYGKVLTVHQQSLALPVASSSAATPQKARKSRAHKNDLLKLDPVDIAEQLALWEYSLYIKITPQECLSYAKTRTGPTVIHLQNFCATHDKLGGWVKKSILKHDILSKRADTVEFWIRVAEVCLPDPNKIQ